jgi:anti-sigma factor RsiW
MSMDNEIREQLSAWLDGELPPEQARFLQRRLQADPALRAQWERWQLASAHLRGHDVQPVSARVALAVASAIEPLPAPHVAHGLRPWAAAAAAALALALVLPQWLGRDLGPPSLPALASDAAEPAPLIRDPLAPVGPSSPLAQPGSVQDMPLLVTPGSAPWPRSPLASDPMALEDYVVRHDALAAQPDGAPAQ